MGELVARVMGVRILRVRNKVLFLVGAYVVSFVILRVLGVVGVPTIVISVVSTATDLGIVYYATRVFRGPSEDLRARRPRWRMSEKPTASRRLRTMFVVLAVVMALGVAGNLARLVSGAQLGFRPDGALDDLVSSVLTLGECVLFASLYGRSARWLAANSDETLAEFGAEPPAP